METRPIVVVSCLMSVALLPVLCTARTYTTNFPLTENPISEGNNWINGRTPGLDWANIRTTPGLAFGTEPGTSKYDDSTALLTGSWGPDQTVQATVFSVNQQTNATIWEEVEIRLRSSISAHSNTGYEILFELPPHNFCQVVRWNGPLGQWTSLGYLGSGVHNGDVVKATIVGNVITVYVNGVSQGQVIDSTYKSGSPGMGFYLEGTTGVNSHYGFTRFTATDGLGDEGWRSLFNGKDLSGWEVKCLPQDRERVFWKVNNGAIECNSIGEPKHNYVWLVTEKEFTNFEFRLKFQVFKFSKGNSGVQFRSRYDDSDSAPNGGWLNGPQIDIHPPMPFRTGLIYDETQGVRRWIHPSLKDSMIVVENAPPSAHYTELKYADNDPDAWNTLGLICDGMKIKTLINGRIISDYDATGILDDEVHRAHNVGTRGKFALQLHTNDELLIRFKDIEILEKDYRISLP